MGVDGGRRVGLDSGLAMCASEVYASSSARVDVVALRARVGMEGPGADRKVFVLRLFGGD